MRKVSENPEAGTQVWHDFDEANQVHQFVTHYDNAVTQAVFDRNAQLKGHGMGKEWRLARSIPPAMRSEMILRNADPLSSDPDERKRAVVLLNSNEFNKAFVNDFKI